MDTTTDDADVAAPLGVALKLADLPERARRAVELKLRRERVHRLLGQDALERLAAGEAPLHQLAAATLTGAVHALARDTSPTAVGRVLGLADLVDSLEHGTPFDAQSAFHAVRVHASPPTPSGSPRSRAGSASPTRPGGGTRRAGAPRRAPRAPPGLPGPVRH